MKIAIMGTGGVGGYYGSLLARGGHDVTFIARGTHLRAIRENGLQIRSVFGNFQVLPAQATDNPATIGPVDLIIMATKTYHIDEATEAIRSIVGPETIVLPLLNGVDAAERIGTIIGKAPLIGGTTWLSAAIEAPGVIGQYSQFSRIAFGEFNGEKSLRAQKLHDVLASTGATIEWVDDIEKTLWTKYVFIASISAVGSLTRVTVGEYRHVPETRALVLEAMREVTALALARGVRLDQDIVEKTLAFIDNSAVGIKPSMQRDVESAKVSEIESMIGYIVRSGESLGVPVPFMRHAYGLLKPAQIKALEGK